MVAGENGDWLEWQLMTGENCDWQQCPTNQQTDKVTYRES